MELTNKSSNGWSVVKNMPQRMEGSPAEVLRATQQNETWKSSRGIWKSSKGFERVVRRLIMMIKADLRSSPTDNTWQSSSVRAIQVLATGMSCSSDRHEFSTTSWKGDLSSKRCKNQQQWVFYLNELFWMILRKVHHRFEGQNTWWFDTEVFKWVFWILRE